MPRKKKEIILNDTILSNPQHENQSLVKKIKNEKSEKISIEVKENEKFSFFNQEGQDEIVKSNLGDISEDNDNVEKMAFGTESTNDKKTKGKNKTKTETINQIIKSNQDSKITTTFSDTHFSMVFEGARLLTPNVIFSALQYHKYDVFAYKKSWHIIIHRALEKLNADILKNKLEEKLPFFKDSVHLIIYRRAPTLVDEDAVVIMFKYILDALKKDKKNPYGVLFDDNPKIIFKTTSFNDKGEHAVGIRLNYCPEEEKEVFDIEKILKSPNT